ncbi:hypothetical protein V1478_016496 [Vespula squamosa]|uniref:Uncharacterized protein n=1 Tax=Vespula squamosa TaxID=30214 RepID=A0ABD1ZZY6_VESSQ
MHLQDRGQGFNSRRETICGLHRDIALPFVKYMPAGTIGIYLGTDNERSISSKIQRSIGVITIQVCSRVNVFAPAQKSHSNLTRSGNDYKFVSRNTEQIQPVNFTHECFVTESTGKKKLIDLVK